MFIACDETFRALHTTRSRLTLSEAPFSLEHDSSFSLPITSGSNGTNIHFLQDKVVLETNLDLDYWEVDPDWDGVTFKSAAQAQRPVRSGAIPCELKTKAGRNLCVRLVTTQGEQYQLHI